MLASIMESIDHAKLARIVRRHRWTGFGRHKPHYVDLIGCIARDFREAVELGLHRECTQRILDVGTGPGAFPYILRHLGHEVVATEREDDESTMWLGSRLRKWWLQRRFDPDGLRRWLRSRPTLYGDMAELLGIERVRWTVAGHTAAPDLGTRFDLICARLLHFDHPGPGKPVWDVDTWRFFIGDLTATLLSPNGRVFLSFVRRRLDLAPLFKAFEQSGGQVFDHRVLADHDVCRRFACQAVPSHSEVSGDS